MEDLRYQMASEVEIVEPDDDGNVDIDESEEEESDDDSEEEEIEMDRADIVKELIAAGHTAAELAPLEDEAIEDLYNEECD